jgi:uncharacterized protein (DUF58 family)
MIDWLPLPRTLGTFVMIITFLAFTAGSLRNELVLILVGAVFFVILAYSFVAILFLSWLHQKKSCTASVQILTKQVCVGNQGAFTFTLGTVQHTKRKKKFFRLPGILIRYEMHLHTKDGRHIYHLFDPDFLQKEDTFFRVPERGAYYTHYDELAIFDLSGFFRLSFSIPQDTSPRLLATPNVIEETIPVTIRSGGTAHRREPRFLRTDNLTDHRPYIPGDDPRRINWKLYGHLGDLFVRDGEPEPPPHSRLLIMVDTQTDSSLYTPEAGRRGVDLLCEHALALAIEYAHQGMDIRIGYTGGEITHGTQGELAAALAYPAALPLSAEKELPYSSEEQGVLILALPRATAKTTALDRFLEKRGDLQTVDILFIYEDEENHLDRTAEICVGIYGKESGVHARRMGSDLRRIL